MCFTGGKNNQSVVAAGMEANLDTQFGFGLAWPTPGTFYTTGGEPPFTPDLVNPNNTNEPYTYVRSSHHYCNLLYY
jgi:tripeptidyl-peptidase-1